MSSETAPEWATDVQRSGLDLLRDLQYCCVVLGVGPGETATMREEESAARLARVLMFADLCRDPGFPRRTHSRAWCVLSKSRPLHMLCAIDQDRLIS